MEKAAVKATSSHKDRLARVLIGMLTVAFIAALGFGAMRMKHVRSGQTVLSHADDTTYQAVYLKSGQIFFGKVVAADAGFVTLESVFYLQVDDAQQAADQSDAEDPGSAISLTKRGCEIFAPEDKMFVSKDELAYFENIRTDGDVYKGIQSWQDDNPNGLDCSS